MNSFEKSDDIGCVENQSITESQESKLTRFKNIVKEIFQLTKSSDAVAFENLYHAECFRDLRATCRRYLNEWPAIYQKWTDDQVNDAIKTLTDGLQFAENAVVKKQIDFSSSSVLGKVGFRRDDEQIPADQWPSYNTKRRRQSQKDNIYEKEKTEFPGIVPASYSCIKCPSNDHTTSKCPRHGMVCLKCQKEGHVAAHCRWQICARCGLYGHGRQACKSQERLCGKCGSPNHLKINCKSSRLYCRLCGGKHKMLYCRDYDGSCYAHCGRHLYKHCPDQRRRK